MPAAGDSDGRQPGHNQAANRRGDRDAGHHPHPPPSCRPVLHRYRAGTSRPDTTCLVHSECRPPLTRSRHDTSRASAGHHRLLTASPRRPAETCARQARQPGTTHPLCVSRRRVPTSRLRAAASSAVRAAADEGAPTTGTRQRGVLVTVTALMLETTALAARSQWERVTVSSFKTCEWRVARHRKWAGRHGRRMSKARLVITAVVAEGLSQGEAVGHAVSALSRLARIRAACR